jgi:hypothetical protein
MHPTGEIISPRSKFPINRRDSISCANVRCAY